MKNTSSPVVKNTSSSTCADDNWIPQVFAVKNTSSAALKNTSSASDPPVGPGIRLYSSVRRRCQK